MSLLRDLSVTETNSGTKTKTEDDEVSNLLKEILIEMKKMNLHLTILTDNQIDESDTG